MPVPPFSAFSDLCCATGYVSPAVPVPTSALHKSPFPSVASCFLGRGSLGLPPEGSLTGKHSNKQQGNAQTTVLALSRTHLREHGVHRATVNK